MDVDPLPPVTSNEMEVEPEGMTKESTTHVQAVPSSSSSPAVPESLPQKATRETATLRERFPGILEEYSNPMVTEGLSLYPLNRDTPASEQLVVGPKMIKPAKEYRFKNIVDAYSRKYWSETLNGERQYLILPLPLDDIWHGTLHTRPDDAPAEHDAGAVLQPCLADNVAAKSLPRDQMDEERNRLKQAKYLYRVDTRQWFKSLKTGTKPGHFPGRMWIPGRHGIEFAFAAAGVDPAIYRPDLWYSTWCAEGMMDYFNINAPKCVTISESIPLTLCGSYTLNPLPNLGSTSSVKTPNAWLKTTVGGYYLYHAALTDALYRGHDPFDLLSGTGSKRGPPTKTRVAEIFKEVYTNLYSEHRHPVDRDALLLTFHDIILHTSENDTIFWEFLLEFWMPRLERIVLTISRLQSPQIYMLRDNARCKGRYRSPNVTVWGALDPYPYACKMAMKKADDYGLVPPFTSSPHRCLGWVLKWALPKFITGKYKATLHHL